MTWHCRWLQIKILGKIILHDPPFPNHCYPASWVMKFTLCVFHCWGATFINSSRLSSSHPASCSVTTVALEAEGNFEPAVQFYFWECHSHWRPAMALEEHCALPCLDQQSCLALGSQCWNTTVSCWTLEYCCCYYSLVQLGLRRQ